MAPKINRRIVFLFIVVAIVTFSVAFTLVKFRNLFQSSNSNQETSDTTNKSPLLKTSNLLKKVKYVFINETTDHRFDESIRVSIIAAKKRTGVQHAVLISNQPIPNDDINYGASQIFKELHLGESQSGKAILYYFVPDKKLLKIEVGYALEGVLPDIIIHRLEMAAKSFIYSDHYQDFWAELINTLNIEIFEKQSSTNPLPMDYFKDFQFLSGGAGKTSYSYDASWEQLVSESKLNLGKYNQLYKAQNTVEGSLATYLDSLKNGVGASNLDVLSTESRFYRNQKLLTSYNLYRNWSMYTKAGIDKIITAEPLAFVFYRPNHPVLPIILKKENDLWRVHEPLSWSLFQRFEDSNQVFLKYKLTGLNKDMQSYLQTRFARPLFDLEKPLSINYLAQKPNMSDLYSPLIHLYWLEKAEKNYSNLPSKEWTTDDLYLMADIYNNLGQFSNFLQTYRQLAKRLPQKLDIQNNLKFYEDVLNFKNNEWILSRP